MVVSEWQKRNEDLNTIVLTILMEWTRKVYVWIIFYLIPSISHFRPAVFFFYNWITESIIIEIRVSIISFKFYCQFNWNTIIFFPRISMRSVIVVKMLFPPSGFKISNNIILSNSPKLSTKENEILILAANCNERIRLSGCMLLQLIVLALCIFYFRLIWKHILRVQWWNIQSELNYRNSFIYGTL